MTARWPLDFDTLQKGDVITVERIETVMSTKRDDPHFWREKMHLRAMLLKARPDFTVREVRGDLVICIDDDAAKYNENRFDVGVRTMVRSHERNTRVDIRNLSPERRGTHDATLVRQGRQLHALVQVRRELRLNPVVRNTPGLPSATDEPTSRTVK